MQQTERAYQKQAGVNQGYAAAHRCHRGASLPGLLHMPPFSWEELWL